jgi:hypothetical protein
VSKQEVEQLQVASERITIGMIPRVTGELEQLRAISGMSKTDLVNRAISLYSFITKQLQAGRQIVIRDPQTGEHELVHLI